MSEDTGRESREQEEAVQHGLSMSNSDTDLSLFVGVDALSHTTPPEPHERSASIGAPSQSVRPRA